MSALLRTHAIEKLHGASFTVDGSFTYQGPANIVRVLLNLLQTTDKTLLLILAVEVSVNASSTFTSYSFNFSGTIPTKAVLGFLDGKVLATEQETNKTQSITHFKAYLVVAPRGFG